MSENSNELETLFPFGLVAHCMCQQAEALGSKESGPCSQLPHRPDEVTQCLTLNHSTTEVMFPHRENGAMDGTDSRGCWEDGLESGLL